MTSKAKKLAWELLALFAKYSEREVEEALQLLSDGKIFFGPIELARKVAQLTKQKSRPSTAKTPTAC